MEKLPFTAANYGIQYLQLPASPSDMTILQNYASSRQLCYFRLRTVYELWYSWQCMIYELTICRRGLAVVSWSNPAFAVPSARTTEKQLRTLPGRQTGTICIHSEVS